MTEVGSTNTTQATADTAQSGFDAPKVEFRAVDIIFGAPGPGLDRSLALLDAGATRSQIAQETGYVLGVTNADLSVAEGEISVLMGLSGSGKSTLLRSLNGLNPVSRGTVLLRESNRSEATNLSTCDAVTLQRVRRHSVAMVFQQFALLPWRTVEQNVGLGLELRGVAEAERKASVAETLKMVGLTEWTKHHPHQLSGGMQQRVGLARAFATNADILLMDEPFSALDPLIRTHLQNELLRLQTTLKKTIVFVSHDLDEAIKLGQRISIMEEGRIVQHGAPEQIVLNPANEYVREFVAHMNPNKVLRGTSLMCPLAQLPRSQNRCDLDAGRYWLDLNAQEHAHAAHNSAGQTMHLLPFTSDLDLVQTVARPSLFLAPMETLLEDIIAMRHASGAPVLLCDGERVAGIVRDKEIYAGLLRQK